MMNEFYRSMSAYEESQRYKGRQWTTAELQRDFDVIGFAAPYVVVKRKLDGQKGSLEFTHSPRVYFNFVADKP